jgi:hypothetical protein
MTIIIANRMAQPSKASAASIRPKAPDSRSKATRCSAAAAYLPNSGLKRAAISGLCLAAASQATW